MSVWQSAASPWSLLVLLVGRLPTFWPVGRTERQVRKFRLTRQPTPPVKIATCLPIGRRIQISPLTLEIQDLAAMSANKAGRRTVPTATSGAPTR